MGQTTGCHDGGGVEDTRTTASKPQHRTVLHVLEHSQVLPACSLSIAELWTQE